MGVAEGFVLLAEDSPGDEFLIVAELEMSPLVRNVEVARDGQQALDFLLGDGRPLPQLVLLDLKLPRIDGSEVLRRLRSHPRTRLLPVVILSSAAEERDLLTAYSSGANAYVRKPVNADALGRAIRQLADFWLAVNEVAPSAT